MRRNYPDTLAGVKALIREQALENVAVAIEKMTDAETARWIPDPQVENVWGLEDRRTGKMLVVVYLEDSDFEVSAEGDFLLHS